MAGLNRHRFERKRLNEVFAWGAIDRHEKARRIGMANSRAKRAY